MKKLLRIALALSLAGTTAINLQFVSTGANLNTTTACAGEVLVRYEVVP